MNEVKGDKNLNYLGMVIKCFYCHNLMAIGIRDLDRFVPTIDKMAEEGWGVYKGSYVCPKCKGLLDKAALLGKAVSDVRTIVLSKTEDQHE